MAEEQISLEEQEDLAVTDKETPEVIVEGEEPIVEEAAPEDFYKNLAEEMDERELKDLSNQLISDYKNDKETRKDWEQTYVKGLDLLGFKYTQQSKPFTGASGVTHPLLAEAVTQFQAQAYKELLPADGPVRTQIVGIRNPEREDQAERVKEFMNYMLIEKMEEYTPEFDQLLFMLPLAGSAFKKINYDAVMDRAVSKFVPAEDLVVPYYASNLSDCERVTYVMRMSDNQVRKNQVAGIYRDIELDEPENKQTDIQNQYNRLEGTSKPSEATDERLILEMHIDLDIEDSEEGIKIPYIVTLDENSGEILRIIRNYREEDTTYKKINYFVHYKFLPGLGFYGFGLIHMIGGLSTAATSALRQLLDAGTLANLPAGFKARGMRIRDDDQPIQPGEFRDVDAPGGNIRDQFQLLPFKEPSATLFQLLGFCVDAGKRFAGIADMQTGEDAQNRAVGTTIALLERGARVMSAIHKRLYYSMKQEFKILSRVIAEYLPPVYPYDVYGGPRQIKSADFDNRVDILPVADPNIMSMAQRVTLAQAQLQIAQSNPQMHNLHEAYRRVYEALGTKTIDQILKPPPKQPEPLDPAKENARSLQMKLLTAFEFQDHDAHISAHMAFMASRMVQINPQVYALLQSHISDHISFKAKAQVKETMMQNPEMVQLAQQDPQQFEILFEAEVAKVAAQITSELVQTEMQANTGKQDPLIKIKQQEIDLRAMDLQRKAEETRFRAEQENQRAAQRLEYDYDKLAQQDSQSDERLEIAREKIQSK